MGTRKGERRLTLDQPVAYEITVPGHLDERWQEWNGPMRVRLEYARDGSPVTCLSGKLDQAALHGLLRRLYALGLPLISAVWIGAGPPEPPLAGRESRAGGG